MKPNLIFSYQEQDSAFFYYNKGLNSSYKNNADSAYIYFSKSLNIYKINNLKDSIAECNKKIFEVLDSQLNSTIEALPYLEKYKNYAENKKDTIKLIISDAYYAAYYYNKNFIKSEKFYKNGLYKSKLIKNNLFIANFYTNLGSLYNRYDTVLDINNHKKAVDIYKKLNLNHKLFSAYLNFSEHYRLKENYTKSIQQLKLAEAINPDRYNKKLLEILFDRLSVNYQLNKNYKEAYHYFFKKDSISNLLNNTQQNIAISEINEKYDNEKLRADNLASEAKRKRNQNLFYGTLSILFFSGIIFFQYLKNSKRKRLLAEQQKELAKQKNITLLKEQEITTINAMVDGQEKERIRIAEDLHDNIGSVLATLKLHFENLKLNREKKHFDQEALYLKTEKLIDETYFKVRNLAHAKNAGVIANKGLLTAVKIMATKISDANKITIEVLDFGLEKRLENSLELTIFRIIQELTTNIIKHAEATSATINLSLYDNNLNIIIEDNGKGFQPKQADLKNDGMGLGSIKTRINHLNGTFNIDSTLDKGTSILINIPV